MGKRQKPPSKSAIEDDKSVCRSDFTQWKSDIYEMMRSYLKEYKTREGQMMMERIDRKIDEIALSIKSTMTNQSMIRGRPFIRESEAMQRYRLSKQTFYRFRAREGLKSFLIGSENCYFIEDLEEFLLDRSVAMLKQTTIQPKRKTSNKTNNNVPTKS